MSRAHNTHTHTYVSARHRGVAGSGLEGRILLCGEGCLSPGVCCLEVIADLQELCMDGVQEREGEEIGVEGGGGGGTEIRDGGG